MRAHDKKGAPTGFSTSSKLSNEQWDAVLLQLSKEHKSIRSVSQWVLANYGITIAPSAIAANRRVQEWRSQERIAVAEQASATLQAHVGEVAEIVVDQLDILRREAKSIRKQIDEIHKNGPSEDGPDLKFSYDRLKVVEAELLRTTDTFNKLLANSKDLGALDASLKAQDQAEAEAAIDLLIETLKVEVVPLTDADRILNDRHPKPSGTNQATEPGEAGASSPVIPV